MLTTRLACAGALALLAIPSALAQQSPLDTLRYRTFGSTISDTSTLIEIDASGAAELTRDYGSSGLVQGPPEPALRTQLTPAERDMLDRALRAPGLDQVPSQTTSPSAGYSLARLEVRFADGRPPLSTSGRVGRYGAHDPLLLPIEAVVQEVRKRLEASSTEVLLQIKRANVPRQIRSDETLEFDVGGDGQPGLEFVGVRTRLSKRYLHVEAVARQVPIGPAQPWSARVRVPRAGRVGRGYLHVKLDDTVSSSMVRIYHATQPQDGVYTGKIVRKDGVVALELETGETGKGQSFKRLTERLPLDAQASDVLGRFTGEVAQFKGSVDGAGLLRIDELLTPTRHTLPGVVRHNGRFSADAFGSLYPIGPAAWNLRKVEPDTRVELEGWVFEVEQVTPPRKWYDTGGRSIHMSRRVWVERIKARVTEGAKLKQGWRTVGRVQPGDEVWVSDKRVFGWSVNVTSLDGTLAGRMRSKRLDFEQPAASGSAVPTSGIVGGLPSAQ